MDLYFTPYALTLLVTAIFALGVAVFAWQRRQMHGGRAFFRTMLGTVWWAFALSLELAALQTSHKVTFSKLEYLGVATVPVFWFVFVSRYTRHDKWLTRSNHLLLWVIPGITLFLVMTNEWHGWYWNSIQTASERLPEVTHGRIVVYGRGLWFWVYSLYAYGLLVVSTVALLNFSMQTAQAYRQQTRLLILASMMALLGSVPYLLRVVEVETTPIAITLAGLLTALNISRFRLLEIAPIARDVLFENLQDGVIVVNPHGRIVDINSEAERLLDKRVFIGQPITTALQPYPAILKVYEEQSEREVTVGNLSLEVRATPLVAPRHEIVGYLMTLRDMTLRNKTETALKENVENLNLLRRIDTELNRTLALDVVLDIGMDAVIRGSRATDGFIAVLEEEALVAMKGFGGYYDSAPVRWNEGIVGRVIRKQTPEWIPDVTADPDYIAQLSETRAQITFPLMNRRHLVGVLNVESRHEFSVEVFEFLKLIATRLAAALDNARLYALSQTQLLELRRLYEKIKSLEQLKTDMIRLAAHDIRSPVNTVVGFVYLLQDSPNLDEDEKGFLESILRAARNIQRITEDILSLQRIEQMHDEGTYAPLNLNELVQSIFDNNWPQAEEKQQQYQLTLPEQGVMVWGDGAQLREAVENLVGNAIKYTPEKGSVSVTLQRDGDKAIFEVRDTGYGIPESMQARLFQPFYRAKTEETAAIVGTGLGLHLVKSIIERHQGKMHFQSVYGQGSTFGFEIKMLS